MPRPRQTEEVGPYLLVRVTPSGARYIDIFNVYPMPRAASNLKLADLWVTYQSMGVPPEWHVYCHACPAPTTPARKEGRTKNFMSRERALSWLKHHRGAKHPVQ